MTRASLSGGVPSTANRLAASITPHAQEKCIAGTKARRVPKVAELIDLYWDGELKDGSSDQAASVPVPAKW